MPSREVLESHPLKVLRAEVAKQNVFRGYTKYNKSRLIDEMLKHKDRFHHIQMKVSDQKPKARSKAKPKAKGKGKSNVIIELSGPVSNIKKTITLSKDQVQGKEPLTVSKVQLQSMIKGSKK
tara:strand:- start:617 stop:982 length:366 start_codon:yes stop_codon:yes gene_type:complete